MTDPQRLARIREMPCALRSRGNDAGPTQFPCFGATEANHAVYTGRGKGTKADDADTFPLCAGHHQQWHDGSGYFKGWGKDSRKKWEAAMLVIYRDPGGEYF